MDIDGEMSIIDDPVFCCCCGKQIDLKIGPEYLDVMYKAPDDIEFLNLIAVVCKTCHLEAQTPVGLISAELMINARITRINNPEKRYKPNDDNNSGRGDLGP